MMLWALIFSLLSLSLGDLQMGFYSNSCPNAEAIVSSVVREASISDPTIPPALLRLHYHDCIVQGCDGSILIQGLPNGEKESANHAGLRGFPVIDAAKARLEAECSGVVSCADIVALAARDSVALSQGPSYQVPTGRRDGTVSNIDDAANMPLIGDTIQVIKQKFADKGLSGKDLVLLNAAHTIGTTACFFLQKRLYSFSDASRSDPRINPDFLPELESRCPLGGSVNDRLSLDHGSERTFDKQILLNIRFGHGVIESDAMLYTDDASTQAIIDSYVDPVSPLFGASFEKDFAESMVRMGNLGVRTGSDGEIRRTCSEFNS